MQSLAGASSDARSASPATAGGDTGSCPPHVFPVLAASLAFLRRIEVALETSVFEKLVGEVLSLVSFCFIVVFLMRDSGSAGGMWVHRLVSGCNQRTKWENSRASFCVSVAASTAGGHAGTTLRTLCE